MKKLSITLVAMLLLVAIGGVAVSQAGKKKFSSNVTLNHSGGGYYEAESFSGKVNATKKKSRAATSGAKKKCKKGRTVKIKRVGAGAVAKTKTNKKGKYAVSADVGPGSYVAVAPKKKVGKKVICKKGKSSAVTVG